MRRIRTAVVTAVAITGLIATTGVAQAMLTEDVLLTESEAQQATGYAGALTRQTLPVATPGLLMRAFDTSDLLPTTFTVIVIDPQGTPAKDASKGKVDQLQEQAKANNPGMECKIYENKNPKFTVVCWTKDPAMVMAFSSDLKAYTKKKKVNGRMRNVVFKEILILGQVQRYILAAGSGSEDDTDTGTSAVVTEADRARAAKEAMGLRDAQKAKLPAQYS